MSRCAVADVKTIKDFSLGDMLPTLMRNLPPISSNTIVGLDPGKAVDFAKAFEQKFIRNATLTTVRPDPQEDSLTMDKIKEAMFMMRDRSYSRAVQYGQLIAREHFETVDRVWGAVARYLPDQPPRLFDGSPHQTAVDPRAAKMFLWGPEGEWTGIVMPRALMKAAEKNLRDLTNVPVSLGEVCGGHVPSRVTVRFVVVRPDGRVMSNGEVGEMYRDHRYIYDPSRRPLTHSYGFEVIGLIATYTGLEAYQHNLSEDGGNW